MRSTCPHAAVMQCDRWCALLHVSMLLRSAYASIDALAGLRQQQMLLHQHAGALSHLTGVRVCTG